MARDFFEFDKCLVSYRTTPFSAEEGMAIAATASGLKPQQLLRLTEVKTANGEWVSLRDPKAINDHVRDAAGIVSPHVALGGVMTTVRRHNFEFLDKWEPVPVPHEFTLNVTLRKRDNVNPILSRLMKENYATKRELQEYYSLKDAFDMFDVICLSAVNEAIAQKKAEIEAKAKAKSKGRG